MSTDREWLALVGAGSVFALLVMVLAMRAWPALRCLLGGRR